MTTKPRVNERLIRWRMRDLKRQGLEPSSASSLAKMLGISNPYMSQLLKGNRDLDIVTINRIAFALGIDPELLLDSSAVAA